MATTLITGSNRGIGLELARQYVADEWNVIATVRDLGKTEALKNLQGSIEIHELDVRNIDSIRNLSRKLQDESIDVLISNAGVSGGNEGLGDLNRSVWLETFAVNTIGPLLLAEALLKNVCSSSQKKLIALSSRMGSISQNTHGDYYAYRSSKAGLNAAWRSLAIDTADTGAIAVMLHPGWVRTDMGGPNADIDVVESATGIRRVISDLTADNSGRFYDYTGKELPW